MKHQPHDIPAHPTSPAPKYGFLRDCVRVQIVNIFPLKTARPHVKKSIKYLQIMASVQEVGLVEPPVIMPIPGKPDLYFLLDGHLRIEILKDLGKTEVDCLVATNDDTYTYNKRITALSTVQDHKMVVHAMEHGVSAERLGKALGLAAITIKYRFRLLNGICDEAVALLADTTCPAKVFDHLRKMKALRQIEVAELMVGAKNYSAMFANALLAATPDNQMSSESKTQPEKHKVSIESMARLERELASLQMQIKFIEDSYGPDMLQLTIITSYLTKLLANAAVVRWLAKNQPEYLAEFQRITDINDVAVSA